MRRALTISGIFIGSLAALTLLAMLILPPLLTKGPMPEALVAMESTATVTVEDGRPITFTPTGGAASGLIIYPGGFVEPRSYAPAAHALASEGIFVAIVPMPFSLAVLGSSRADGVIEDHPEIAKQGVLLRKFGQEVIRVTSGKRIHGTGAIPGGVNKSLDGGATWQDRLSHAGDRIAELSRRIEETQQKQAEIADEPGKLADIIVVDRDLLECPLEDFSNTQVLRTYLGGTLVWEAKGS